MKTKGNRWIIPGSEYPVFPSYGSAKALSNTEELTYHIYIRSGKPLPDIAAFNTAHPSERKYLSQKEFRSQYAASKRDTSLINRFAKDYQLKVDKIDPVYGRIIISGTAANWNQAFDTQLLIYTNTTIAYKGSLSLPAYLTDVVLALYLFKSTSPQAPAAKKMITGPFTAEPDEQGSTYLTPELGRLYNFPSTGKGKGQKIAILEFDGGYLTSDIKTYFKLIKTPIPDIRPINEEGYKPSTTTLSADAFFETNLDIQVAGALAPEAEFLIYQFPNGPNPYGDAIFAATFNPKEPVDIISISYDTNERLVPQMMIDLTDRAMQIASLLGITVCVASGDGGSPTRDASMVGSQYASVNYPAICSYALACGGTYTEHKKGQISLETVWNDLNQALMSSCGGRSVKVPVPEYQKDIDMPENANIIGKVNGRGVPDVAGNASPLSPYEIIIKGEKKQIGGTSAVAPLWSALIAIMNENLGFNLGFLHNELYKLQGTEALVSITQGNNGAYAALPGWDGCTGLGRPDGKALLKALKPSKKS